MIENPGLWNNEYLIYLNVKNERDLVNWKFKLDIREIKYSEFREPDLDNQITAIACESDGRIFKKCQLLKGD